MIDELAALVGAAQVSTESDILLRASGSWYPPRLKKRETSFQVQVKPGSTDDVAAVVRWAAERGVRLRSVGGATNVVGAASTATVALDLSRLDSVSLDETALTITAGAGLTLDFLEQQLARHQLTLGQALGSSTLATVGGCVATNAIGLFSGRYGRFADSVLALEVVLASGEIITTTPQAAFDIHRLFIGSEGAFGIVTRTTLALHPAPEARAFAVFDFTTPSDAVDALRLVYRSDSRPALARALLGATPRLVLAFEGDELAQTGNYQLAYAVCQTVGGVARPESLGESDLERRERGDLWAANAREGVFADVLTLFAPWTALSAVIDAVKGALEGRVDALALEVCHPNPHGAALEAVFTLTDSPQRYHELIAATLAAAEAAGARFPHHLGVGEKLAAAVSVARPTECAVLRALKNTLDPKGIFPPCP